jgi:hypothetical protein
MLNFNQYNKLKNLNTIKKWSFLIQVLTTSCKNIETYVANSNWFLQTKL